MGIKFYSGSFREEVNGIELNVLGRSYNSVEEGDEEGIESKCEIDGEVGELDLNEGEDGWGEEEVNKVGNGVRENMEYGNGYCSVDDIVGSYGDII